MLSLRSRCFGLILFGLVGCSSAATTMSTSDAALDAAPPRPACPLPATTSLPTCAGWPIPDSGCRVGSLNLKTCDDGPDVKVGPDATCKAEVTVVFSWAGWCSYCQGIATNVEAELVEKYRGKGVRFVAAMTRNPDYTPPTAEFCRWWKDRYKLVDFEIGLDPDQNTVSTILREHSVIDRHGRIRKALNRSDSILDDVSKAIDEVLANPD